MICSVLCSCGVLLRSVQGSVLIDAPNENYPPYECFPDSELQKILFSEYPYNVPLCIAFTHLHPDHFSEEKLHRILDARPNTVVILPTQAPQKQTLFDGTFVLESYPVIHTKAPGFDDILHNVFYLSGEKTVYITADAVYDVAQHEQILAGRIADFAFYNAQYMSYPDTRRLLNESAKKTFIYHIPLDEPDVSGMRRKAVHNLERCKQELLNTGLILQYPYRVL